MPSQILPAVSNPPAGLALEKAPTGIKGLDEITEGGLPRGRPTLLAGSAGAGKTLMAMEFLIRGVSQFGENGVALLFEETAEELITNVRTLGFPVEEMVAQGKLVIDHVRVERSEIEETGNYDLEGLFIRLGYAIDRVGAKRVVLDTVEALFAGLPNHGVLRAELRRLFRFLKEKGVTALITGEKGEGFITRYGLEEYVADCVITLDHRVTGQVSTRRLRIVKYRGSPHGTNEYPFLIGKSGVSVMPITSLRLEHEAPAEHVGTGIAGLDEMLQGKGVYRGASVLVSGAPGTGKSSIGANFAHAACARGERALLFAYEESAAQIIRNMRSIGLNLQQWIDQGLLQIHSSRPTLQGLEQHLVAMNDTILEFAPSVVAVDPISNLSLERDAIEVKPTLMRLIDLMKREKITAVFTSLTSEEAMRETPVNSEVGISSLMDVWLLLRNHEADGERNRTIFVLKARGMPHSNQVREFLLTDDGVQLVDVYLGADGVLTGTARAAQEAKDRQAAETRLRHHQRRLRKLASRQKAIEARLSLLQSEAEEQAAELVFEEELERLAHQSKASSSELVAHQRRASSGLFAAKSNSSH